MEGGWGGSRGEGEGIGGEIRGGRIDQLLAGL